MVKATAPNASTVAVTWEPVPLQKQHGKIIGYRVLNHQANLCSSISCAAADQCHGSGTCGEGGSCTNPRLPNGTPCDDGSNATYSDACFDGGCVGIPLPGHTSTLSLVATLSINSYSHGAAYAPHVNEYWMPQWSGSTVYRFEATSLQYQGTFNMPVTNVMQLWVELAGDRYYTANYGLRYCAAMTGWPGDNKVRAVVAVGFVRLDSVRF